MTRSSTSHKWFQLHMIIIHTSKITLNPKVPYKVSTLTLTGLEKLIMMRAGCL